MVYLNLHSNPGIISIKPLAGLINLETLILADARVKDEISVLQRYSRLKHLNLSNTGISDLSPLSNLTDLEYLNLHHNDLIESINPLAGMVNLHTLILANVPIGDDAAVIQNFSNLQHLNLRNTEITDLKPLAGLIKLEYLNLHSNPEVISIAPIAKLAHLRTLILQDVPVGNQIGILINFPNLTQVNLRNTGITETNVIASLMANGAFKDDLQRELYASINIIDNPLNYIASDSYASLRPYWEKFNLRTPFVLPEHVSLPPPSFSHSSGFYTDSFLLTLSSEEPTNSIHYTLDGSEPTRDSPLYITPIPIESRKDESNGISEIKNTSLSDRKPDGKVFKGTVVRAKVFDSQDSDCSLGVTQTYFVDEQIYQRYSLPLVSITTDADYLFDSKVGIFSLGQVNNHSNQAQFNNPVNQVPNYDQDGKEWERPIYIELIEQTGQTPISQNASIRLHGDSARRLPQKALRIYAHTENNPQGVFTYGLFPGLLDRNNQPGQNYDSFILRNSGNDWDEAMLRDSLTQNLVRHTSLGTQAFRPVIVFINGEYWGIHDLRPRLDEYYLASTYHVDRNQVTILDEYLDVFRGNPGDNSGFINMLEYIKKNNLNEYSNYEYIQTLIDVDNYIDYQVSEIYSANTDWPDSNEKIWRFNNSGYDPNAPPGQDGRWRWILFDSDFGFMLSKTGHTYDHKTLELAENSEGNGYLLAALLQNEMFKTQFINQFADHLNTSFKAERVVSEINHMQDELRPEMEEHIRRWRTMQDSINVWEHNVDILRMFARNRPNYIRQQIIERFGLPGTAAVTLQTDPEKGYIQVNSISITPDTPGVENPGSWSGIYFMEVPIQIKAVAYPGYSFAGWDGLDLEGDQIIHKLTGDLTLQANFIPIP